MEYKQKPKWMSAESYKNALEDYDLRERERAEWNSAGCTGKRPELMITDSLQLEYSALELSTQLHPDTKNSTGGKWVDESKKPHWMSAYDYELAVYFPRGSSVELMMLMLHRKPEEKWLEDHLKKLRKKFVK